MTGFFEWLLKLLVIVMLIPCALSLFGHIFFGLLVALLPWVLGLAGLVGLTAGLAAGLALRRRLPPRQDRFPPGEVPRIRRPRGIRTER